MSTQEPQRPGYGESKVRVRASGVAQVRRTGDEYELRVFESIDEAIEHGDVELAGRGRDYPDTGRCSGGYDVTVHPEGGFVFTCRQTDACPGGRCHIFTREAGAGEWVDQGPSWHERDVLAGFAVCGCAAGPTA